MLRAVLAAVTSPPRTPPAPPAPPGPAIREAPMRERIDWWHLAPVLVALVFAVVYLIWQPRTVDMSAHEFRADLFGEEGFTIWNGQWYGGHHTPAYSVLSPPLAWLLSPPLALVAAALASAALFGPLARGAFGEERARWGAIWFGVGTGTLLFTTRLPFALGVAFGLAALLAFQRRRHGLAAFLAVLCPLGSPVAGVFLAMAAVAVALADRDRRRAGLLLGVAAFVPPIFLNWAFPEGGGWAPFPTTYYLPIPVFTVAGLLLVPREQRTLRLGILLYGLGSTLALLIETPMGGTVARLGALFGGPVLLCAIWGRPVLRGRLGVLIAIGLLGLGAWQWAAPWRDVRKYLEDPAAQANYFEPLRQYLLTLKDQRRVEIPFTRSHWEGAEIAPETALARGWLRQLDTGLHPIFYKGEVNQLNYASWLAENGVRYVALSSALPDKAAIAERALIERGLRYLRLRWKSADWRVFEVLLPAPIVVPQDDARITLDQMGSDELLLDVLRPGEAIVRVRWTPYWYASNACVERDGNWTRIIAEEKGFVRLSTRFSPERLFSRGRRCAD